MFKDLLFALGCIAIMAAPALGAEGTLEIQVDQPGATISPLLFGIFFEEINCAGDGGLYAEQVRNRSFEESAKPDFWAPVGGAALAVDAERPLRPSNPHALRLETSGRGFSGAANDGYWGMAVTEGAEYNLTLWARCGDGLAESLEARLEGADGKVYASAVISGITETWAPFTAALKANATDPQARLVLGKQAPGVVWLDVVSLFPADTFKGRANGLRPDLARMLAELKPAFMRFPGGCWVEGDTLAFAQRWKKTIGDIGDRRTQYNIWQYYSTNGLGYHEYLLCCEDLGTEPLFVVNCGMSHKENVPMDQLAEWVQDALDAIEYANGAADTPWGAVRARNGHPAPFDMKYIEVGNENGGPAYQERYAVFYDAIKAKYPDMKIVANVVPELRPADIVDEHYYSTPEFFMANANKYDTYKRDGHKIFVGEYACTQGCGGGNLRAALGEAAFMTGLERNGDVVALASYAPLFSNVHYRKWSPNLINFDSARVYGLPSYYVQKLFSENRGDVVLPLTLSSSGSLKKEPARGAVGVGTWETEAQYKDIRVERGGNVLYASDFAAGHAGWRLGNGKWAAEDGTLVQRGNATDCRATVGDPTWADYTLTLKARKLDGQEGFLILFQYRDDGNFLWWNLGGWGNQRHGVERSTGGSRGIIGEAVPGQIERGRWYDIRIETAGDRVRCHLDNKLIHEIALPEIKPLYAVASRRGNEIILKAVNVSPEDIDTAIALKGAATIAPDAAGSVLTSASGDDENSLEEPFKVAPKEIAIHNAGTEFRHTFPANSFTVLRLQHGVRS